MNGGTESSIQPVEPIDAGGLGRGAARRVRSAWTRRAPRTRVMLVLTVAVLVLNVSTVFNVTRVSAIDEQYYIDDLLKASQLDLNQQGDFLDDETLVELCARGHQYPERVVYRCQRDRQNPRQLVPGGVNPLNSLPPYFFVTGLTARALRALPIDLSPGDSLVTWARLLGSAWLLLGCWFALRVAEMLGIRLRYAGIALIAAISVPTVIHASTIVNPDATAFAGGAGVLCAVLAWERGRCRLWVPVLAAVVGAAMKLPNTVGIAIVLLYLTGRAIQTRTGSREPEQRAPKAYLAAIGSLAVGTVLAVRGLEEVWVQIRYHVMGRPDTYVFDDPDVVAFFNAYAVDKFPTDRIFSWTTLRAFLPPVPDIALPDERSGSAYYALWRVAQVLFVLPLVLVPLVVRRLWDRIVLLDLATIAACVVMPVAFLLYWYLSSSTSDQIVARYGLSALPAMVLVLASGMGRLRFGPWVAGIAGVTLYVAALATNFV